MRRRLLTAGVLLAYAWFGSGLESMTWQATVAVAIPAAVVAILCIQSTIGSARHEPRLELGPALRRTTIAWSVLIGVGLLWEAWAFFHQPAPTVGSWDHPTLSVLLDPVLEHRGVRFAGWLIWLHAGYRLLEDAR